jgi:uncharacterized membrane protein
MQESLSPSSIVIVIVGIIVLIAAPIGFAYIASESCPAAVSSITIIVCLGFFNVFIKLRKIERELKKFKKQHGRKVDS